MRTLMPHVVRTEALQARLTQRRSFLASRRQAGRHARGRASPLERVMRRSAIHSHSVFHVYLQPRARLAPGVVRHTERREVQLTARPQLPLPVRTAWRRMPAIRHELLQRLSERLIERWTVAAAATPMPRPAVAMRVDRRQAAPRIETVMLRSQPPGAKVAAAADATFARAPDQRPRAAPPSLAQPAPPLVLPVQEMSRLTEHVIRQLDHRVLSWQERTGRV